MSSGLHIQNITSKLGKKSDKPPMMSVLQALTGNADLFLFNGSRHLPKEKKCGPAHENDEQYVNKKTQSGISDYAI